MLVFDISLDYHISFANLDRREISRLVAKLTIMKMGNNSSSTFQNIYPMLALPLPKYSSESTNPSMDKPFSKPNVDLGFWNLA